MGSYSTPFVLLTDTFTGVFLGGGDVVGANSSVTNFFNPIAAGSPFNSATFDPKSVNKPPNDLPPIVVPLCYESSGTMGHR